MIEELGRKRVRDALDLESARRIIVSMKDPRLAVRHMLQQSISAETAATALSEQGVQAQVFEGRIKGQVEIDLGLGDEVGGVNCNYIQEKVPMLVFFVKNDQDKFKPLVVPWVVVVDPSSNELSK